MKVTYIHNDGYFKSTYVIENASTSDVLKLLNDSDIETVRVYKTKIKLKPVNKNFE